MLNSNEKKIMEEYNNVIMSGHKYISTFYNIYKDLILIFTRILCEKKYRSKIGDYVKKKYYPIDDCLKIV